MFSFLPNSVAGMTGRKTALLLTALLGGALVMPVPADAQCRLCGEPVTERTGEGDDPRLQLEVQALLDFDQVILLHAGGRGSARLNPDGTGSNSGSVGTLSPRAMVGSILVVGQPGKWVQLGLPAEIKLYGLRGGSIRLTNIVSDAGPSPRLDSQGRLQFRFGGELQIEGEVEGDYRGDVALSVDYL